MSGRFRLALVTTSVAVLLVTVAMCVRSYWYADSLLWVGRGGYRFVVESSRGAVYVVVARGSSLPPPEPERVIVRSRPATAHYQAEYRAGLTA